MSMTMAQGSRDQFSSGAKARPRAGRSSAKVIELLASLGPSWSVQLDRSIVTPNGVIVLPAVLARPESGIALLEHGTASDAAMAAFLDSHHVTQTVGGRIAIRSLDLDRLADGQALVAGLDEAFATGDRTTATLEEWVEVFAYHLDQAQAEPAPSVSPGREAPPLEFEPVLRVDLLPPGPDPAIRLDPSRRPKSNRELIIVRTRARRTPAMVALVAAVIALLFCGGALALLRFDRLDQVFAFLRPAQVEPLNLHDVATQSSETPPPAEAAATPSQPLPTTSAQTETQPSNPAPAPPPQMAEPTPVPIQAARVTPPEPPRPAPVTRTAAARPIPLTPEARARPAPDQPSASGEGPPLDAADLPPLEGSAGPPPAGLDLAAGSGSSAETPKASSSDRRTCRHFDTRTDPSGRQVPFHGTACQRADGTWDLVGPDHP